MASLKQYLSLVRFSHTLFALPFALASMLWAANGLPSARVFLLILVCMVTCRNTAMAFNRLADADLDKDNPRTARRHIPAGILTRGQVLGFLIANASAFIVATWFVNRLAFFLSVPALAAVCGYSLTKRFTSLSHFFLGMAIGISPVGAWIAVRGGAMASDMAAGRWPAETAFPCYCAWLSGFGSPVSISSTPPRIMLSTKRGDSIPWWYVWVFPAPWEFPRPPTWPPGCAWRSWVGTGAWGCLTASAWPRWPPSYCTSICSGAALPSTP